MGTRKERGRRVVAGEAGVSTADQLRALAPTEVLKLCGAEPHSRRGRWTPCPACGSDKGTVQSGDHVWTCYACKVSADAAATASLLAVGRKHAGQDWPDVCRWVEARGWVTEDSAAVVVPSTVTVCGGLPPLPDIDPTLAEVWGHDMAQVLAVAVRATEAGVPDDIALDGARAYVSARLRDRREADAALAAESPPWPWCRREDLRPAFAAVVHREQGTWDQEIEITKDTARAAFGRRWRRVLAINGHRPAASSATGRAGNG